MEIKNEELERLYEESFHGIEVGSILTGKVLSVKPEGVIVDVGYKSEGLIKSIEFSVFKKFRRLVDLIEGQGRSNQGMGLSGIQF
jgi:ribosomal protein S1